ncbi:MAG: thioredoxin family protein [Smithellaceae bacterium]
MAKATTTVAAVASETPAEVKPAIPTPSVSADAQAQTSSAASEKTAADLQKKQMPLVTFVEIGSVNCIPCRAMQPIMNAVEQEYKGQVRIVFHDVWTPKGKADAAKYNIRVIPTQVFLDKDGKEYFRHEGYYPKESVVHVLKMGGIK